MSNKWYPKFLEATLTRAANSALSGTVRFAFLDSSYVYSDAHEFLSSVTGVLGTAVEVTSKAYTGGAFGFTVPDYSGAGLAGDTATQAILYIDTGSAGTSRLVAHFDSAPNLPLEFLESDPETPTGDAEDQAVTVPAIPIAITSGQNHLYPAFAEALLSRPANSDISSLPLMAVFVTGAYTYAAGHDFLDDVPSGQRTGTPQEVDNLTFVDGVVDGDDVTFPGTPGITGGVALVLYLDTGSAGTSRLVAIKRQAQGLPGGGLTTTADQEVRWNSSLGVFRLGAVSA
jgi:hypothetical protein